MGLGKTYIGAEKLIKNRKAINIVVCQKSKIEDWINHFRENYARVNLDYCTKELIFDLTKKRQSNDFLNIAKTEDLDLLPYMIVGVINYDLI